MPWKEVHKICKRKTSDILGSRPEVDLNKCKDLFVLELESSHHKLPNLPKFDYSFNKIPSKNANLVLSGSTRADSEQTTYRSAKSPVEGSASRDWTMLPCSGSAGWQQL